MRQSILRCSSFQSSRHRKLLALIGLCTLSTSLATCRNRELGNSVITGSAQTDVASSVELETARPPLVFRIQPKEGSSIEVAYLEPSRCRDPKSAQRWQFQFTSPLGLHRATIEFPEAFEGSAKAEIDGLIYQVSLAPPWSDSLLAAACAKIQPGNNIVLLDRQQSEPIRNVLRAIAPSCEIQLSDKGWDCTLGQQSLASINGRLADIRTSMLLRWSRHPYILTRRVALAVNVGEALALATEAERKYEIERICRLMKVQIPAELPLAFRAQNTREAVCNGAATVRFAAAQAALSDTLIELEQLRTKLETASHLGTLTVRLPHTDTPKHELWVSLSPIADEAHGLAAKPETQSGRTGCWHPLYAEDAELSQVAQELGMIDRARASLCQHVAETIKSPVSMDHYVANSITSETEFTVANGIPKLLRMPQGDYTYTVRVPITGPEGSEQDSESPEATGIISWKNRRPNPSIIQW